MIKGGHEAGPQALFLHCSLARGQAWAGVARHLGGIRVIAPDLIGHGEARDFDRSQDMHDQATDAVRPMLPDVPSAVVGHSFGATVALRLAIEAPKQVSALVLFEPVLFAAAGEGPGRQATAKAQGPLMPLIEAGQRDVALANFLAVWGVAGAASLKPELRAYMEARIHLIEHASPALNDDRAGLLPRLDQVRVPVLLIEGAESPPVIPEIMGALEAGLPDARRAKIAGAGHMAPVTHAREFAGLVADFLGAEISRATS